MEFDPARHPHSRYNPLRDEWILVSPQRTQRPWMGETAKKQDSAIPEGNPLSPGAVRPNGQKNPDYKSTWWFVNDFPALLEEGPEPPTQHDDAFFRMGSARGRCEVLCFHPNPRLTLATMDVPAVKAVVSAWIERYIELSKKFTWVQLFENRGAMMGSSNPHPHGQIWASSFLPNEIQLKDRTQKEYFLKYGRPMLVDYVKRELVAKERLVCESSHFVALVPFWAVWPYETMIVPKRHVQEICDLTPEEQNDLAVLIKTLLTKYDNLFQCDFPYSMGWHGMRGEHWQLHAMYLPPLLRSATVRKYIVGYELLAQSQRDTSPESAAEILRKLDGTRHYTQ